MKGAVIMKRSRRNHSPAFKAKVAALQADFADSYVFMPGIALSCLATENCIKANHWDDKRTTRSGNKSIGRYYFGEHPLSLHFCPRIAGRLCGVQVYEG